jgi:hypothetical protein
MARPWYLRGPKTIALAMEEMTPDADKPTFSKGLMMAWHYAGEKVVAGRGYWILFMIVVVRDCHTSPLGKQPVLIWSAH